MYTKTAFIMVRASIKISQVVVNDFKNVLFGELKTYGLLCL